MGLVNLKSGRQRLEIDYSEMLEVMSGHEPPKNQPDRDNYFLLFAELLGSQYGEKLAGDLDLLGTGPDCYSEWANDWARRNSLRQG